MIQGENMAVKTRKPPVEEEEEPAPIKRPAAKTPEATVKSSPATKAKAAVAATPQSARWYVTQVLLAGAPREEVKKRAMVLAKKDGAVVSFKTFDVAYFIKYLEGKNYRVREANGTIKVMAPKG
jgi:hypothetical protein